MKKENVIYRKAELKDFDSLIELLIFMPKTGGFDGVLPADRESGERFIKGLFDKNAAILLATYKASSPPSALRAISPSPIKDTKSSILLGSTEVILGCLILDERKVWWSERPVLSNIVFYVYPGEPRKLGIQKRFIEIIKGLSRQAKLPFILDMFSPRDTEHLEPYFKINGFRHIGSKFAFIPTTYS